MSEAGGMEQDQDAVGLAAAEADRLRTEFYKELKQLHLRFGEEKLELLAERAGVSKGYLSSLFNGNRAGLPGHDLLIKIVKAVLFGRPSEQIKQEVEAWRDRRVRTRTAELAADRVITSHHQKALIAAADLVDQAQTKADKVLEEAAHRSAELEAEWHTEVGNRRQSLDRELSEKREQAEAQVNEMAAWAEKVRSDTEAHRGRIIEAATAEVEAGRDRIAMQTAQAIEHVRMETENMRTAARAEADQVTSNAARILAEAEEQAAVRLDQVARAVEELIAKGQADADATRQAAEEDVAPLRVRIEALYAQASELHAAAQQAHYDAHTAAEQLRVNTEAGVEAMQNAAREEIQRLREKAQAPIDELQARTEAEKTREAAEAQALEILSDAREKAGRTLEAAGRDADKLVAMARSEALKIHMEAEQMRADAKREVEEIEIRKQEVKAEMSRVHGVLDALAASVRVPEDPESASA